MEPDREQEKVVIIVGPTASGKTELAVRLAESIDGEIVNADSMQVYKGMDIGTAKPPPELKGRVPHHLLDIVAPSVNFTAADFAAASQAAIADIHRRGRQAIVVGGTGLYIRALLFGLAPSPAGSEAIRRDLEAVAEQYGPEELLRRLAVVDPVTAARLHPNDRVRIIRALEVFQQTGIPISRYQQEHGFAAAQYHYLKIGIDLERGELYRRIDERVERMFADGLVAEVTRLLEQGCLPDDKPMRSIGYQETVELLAGRIDLAEAKRLIARNTRWYAKRQLTWFRREQEIKWVEYPKSFASILASVIAFLEKGAEPCQKPHSISRTST